MGPNREAAIDPAEVAACLRRVGIEVDRERTARLADFATLLERWNRVYNLTGIRDRPQLLDRHLVESLALGPLLRGERIADVGTGAGLPGLPLAIVHPEREFTLIESRRKRVNFMRHAVATLGLGNVEVAHGRAEDLSWSRPFATVLGRAVTTPGKLVEIIKPMTAPGSLVVVLTSASVARRLAEIAHDFSPVSLPAGVGEGLRSSIAMFERTSDEAAESTGKST